MIDGKAASSDSKSLNSEQAAQGSSTIVTNTEPPGLFHVHGASSGRRRRQSRELAFADGSLLITKHRHHNGYRMIFRESRGSESGATRVVEHCTWDAKAATLTGTILLDGDEFCVHAQCVDHYDDKFFLMGLLIPLGDKSTGDEDATGGWTAEAQGGGDCLPD